jgi:hypothetical protein
MFICDKMSAGFNEEIEVGLNDEFEVSLIDPDFIIYSGNDLKEALKKMRDFKQEGHPIVRLEWR